MERRLTQPERQETVPESVEEAPSQAVDPAEEGADSGLMAPDNATLEEVPIDLEETTAPVMAVVSSPFGWRFHPMSGALDFHTGADLSCPEGTRISALLGGTVLVSEYHESYGNYLLLDHGNGFETLYAHCSALLAGEGETVRPGEPIALSGQTGDATGPHLHLEIRMNGVRLNPAWLPFWEDYGKETP